ncbi:MAG: DUF1638 domain-containing protein [Lentisphaeria bacterium]|jgi:hypothetical protein
MAHFKLISCNVFLREACHCLARTPPVVDVEFLELGQHADSAGLRRLLQDRITAAGGDPRHHDAILLLYGLCGNATVGLRNSTAVPLVLPRAHDCATLLLGSRQRFEQHFAAAPSTPFSSVGYLERGDYFLRPPGETGTAPQVAYGDGFAALVEQHGEENARYIWETMHPRGADSNRALFIELPETAGLGHAERCRAQAAAEGKEFVLLPGSLRLIERLLAGDWPADEFLVVPPGHEITGVYDWAEIVRHRPATTP